MSFILILLVVVLAPAAWVTFVRQTNRDLLGTPRTIIELPTAPKKPKLSLPAQEIIKANNSLPVDSQVVGLEDFLRALDVKHDKGLVDYHFSDYSRRFSWICDHRLYPHSYGKCPYAEYREIYDQVEAVLEEIKAQEKAFKVAGVQHELDRKAEIMDSLRNERRLIKDVTKEITGG